jgi:TonB-dependent receptor-like protein/carboxypeptidase family protein
MCRLWVRCAAILAAFCLAGATASAQAGSVAGAVRDETGGALPGVTVELRGANRAPLVALTDGRGGFRFDGVPAGHYQAAFTLINFGSLRREIDVASAGAARLDATLHLSLSADVTVTGKRTFANLADVENPAGNLVGIAQSASQGAITARQLDARPIMRAGEVVETVPGVVISQHGGEGKANQYYLRGFNLDHGTDFSTTVAGMPVNMPTHAHGQGYSDLNFLIPELVSGVQYSKGPYFADQGDFATAGSANINYASVLDRPLARIGGGGEGFGRAVVAASPNAGTGHLLAAFETEHNDGPWDNPDNYRKVNGVLRYNRGDAVNGLSVTAMGYRAKWNSTDQVPRRAVDEGVIDRFGAIDPTDGGDTYRYSGTVEWQRSRNNATTKIVGYGIGYDLNLFSNFTFFLDDPVHGDQFHQADHRFVTGAKATYKRNDRWGTRDVQNTVGLQLRNDDITTVGLYHTQARKPLNTVSQDSVLETSAGGFAQNEVSWTPWLRTLAGLRVDGYRFGVDAGDPENGGVRHAGTVSPKGGVAIGPFKGTELYANAGLGFHSNDARGTTITRDPGTGQAVDPVTPLVRARGAEAGIRSVAVPHLQTSLTAWTLSLASELVFTGDAGTTEPSRPSHRYGIEFANYYAPRPWLILDGDVSWSRARFTESDPVGDYIPGSVATVISGGATLDSLHNVFGSVRLRYFGPRALIEDNSVRSKATSLINLEGGYAFTRRLKLAVDVFNLLNARDSDIDYYYASRLIGEPAGGVDDIHLHPTLPRTARVNMIVGFR